MYRPHTARDSAEDVSVSWHTASAGSIGEPGLPGGFEAGGGRCFGLGGGGLLRFLGGGGLRLGGGEAVAFLAGSACGGGASSPRQSAGREAWPPQESLYVVVPHAVIKASWVRMSAVVQEVTCTCAPSPPPSRTLARSGNRSLHVPFVAQVGVDGMMRIMKAPVP